MRMRIWWPLLRELVEGYISVFVSGSRVCTGRWTSPEVLRVLRIDELVAVLPGNGRNRPRLRIDCIDTGETETDVKE